MDTWKQLVGFFAILTGSVALSWTIGRGHPLRASIIAGKVNLEKLHLTRTSIVYGGFLGAAWVVYQALSPIALHLPTWLPRYLLVCLLSLAALHAFLVIIVTEQLVLGYPHWDDTSFRKWIFKLLWLPILIGSYGLFWVALLPLWFAFAIVLYKKL